MNRSVLKIGYVILVTLIGLMFLYQRSVELYWQQTYHKSSPFYVLWQNPVLSVGEDITDALTQEEERQIALVSHWQDELVHIFNYGETIETTEQEESEPVQQIVVQTDEKPAGQVRTVHPETTIAEPKPAVNITQTHSEAVSAKPITKPEIKPVTETEHQSATSAATAKSELKPDEQPPAKIVEAVPQVIKQPVAITRLDIKPLVESDTKTEPVVKPTTKPEVKPQAKPQVTTEIKPEVQTEISTEVKPEPEPKPKPAPRPNETVQHKPPANLITHNAEIQPAEPIIITSKDKIFFAGDSLMQGVAPRVKRSLYQQYKIESLDLSKQSTGLSYPRSFNWPKVIEETLDSDETIKVLVMFLGPNDPWNFPVSGRSDYLVFKSEQWEATYRYRIDRILEAAQSHNVQVIWLGVPCMRKPKLHNDMLYLNSLYRAEVEKFNQHYIPTSELLGCSDEGYANFVTRDKDSIKVRIDDGIHFTVPGQRILVEKVLEQLTVNTVSEEVVNVQ